MNRFIQTTILWILLANCVFLYAEAEETNIKVCKLNYKKADWLEVVGECNKGDILRLVSKTGLQVPDRWDFVARACLPGTIFDLHNHPGALHLVCEYRGKLLDIVEPPK